MTCLVDSAIRINVMPSSQRVRPVSPGGGIQKASFAGRIQPSPEAGIHGNRITSDAGLLAYRELDDALGLTEIAGAALSDLRRGKNTRHLLIGLLHQSVFGGLARYEDVNDAEKAERSAITPGAWSKPSRAYRAASWGGWTRASPSSASACRRNSGARWPAPTSSRTRWQRSDRPAATSSGGAMPRWHSVGPPPVCWMPR